MKYLFQFPGDDAAPAVAVITAVPLSRPRPTRHNVSVMGLKLDSAGEPERPSNDFMSC